MEQGEAFKIVQNHQSFKRLIGKLFMAFYARNSVDQSFFSDELRKFGAYVHFKAESGSVNRESTLIEYNGEAIRFSGEIKND